MNRSTRSLLRAAAALAPAAVLLAAATVPANAAQREIDRTVDGVLQPVTSVAAVPDLAPVSLPEKGLKTSTTLKRAATRRAGAPAACPAGAVRDAAGLRAAARCPDHDHDHDDDEATPGDAGLGKIVRGLDVTGLVKPGGAGQATRTLGAGAPASARRTAGDHLPKVPGTGVLNGVTRSGTVAPVLETVAAESVLPPASHRRAAGPASPLPLGAEQVQGLLNGSSGDPVQGLLGGVTGSANGPVGSSDAMVSGRLGGLAGGLTDTSGLVPPMPLAG
ncbi:hypothetical protein ACIBF1_02195 [Spirillospora sp. NPDC050679]